MSVIAKNPIMPGFYPDPSICAVGEDFYLIHSSFAYFPGLPLMHSRDLAHWEQIGNVLDREEQLPLQNTGHSRGLFAPTIRYHEGTYYVICTNVSYGGNFIVTAKNPAGPWSEPYYIEGAEGIDPSLFFDTDGTCYYIGTHPNPAGCQYDGDWYIWVQELDLKEMKLVGEAKDVWNGALKGVHWPEGPHLYKKDDYYYIMHAEGGTGPEHAVSICRSKFVFGPYENNFCNPIFTHRHLGKDYPIKYVGHADLFETVKGEWYMVMLAVRPIQTYTTMGRETFLAKVIWENGWPVVNPGVGILTDEVEIDLPEWNPLLDHQFDTTHNGTAGSSRTYDFTRLEKLGDEFLVLRNPGECLYTLDENGLHLKFREVSLKEEDTPAYLAIRQQHHVFTLEASVKTEELSAAKRAGIALVQNNLYHLRCELFKEQEEVFAELILCQDGRDEILAKRALGNSESLYEIRLSMNGLRAFVSVSPAHFEEEEQLCENLDIHALSTEVAGGFVGCTAGLYAVSDRREGSVTFTRLSYLAEL